MREAKPDQGTPEREEEGRCRSGQLRKHRQVDALVQRTEIDERTGLYLIGVRFVEMDLHLSADHPPLIRVNGNLRPLRKEPLPGLDVRDMVYTILDDQHRKVFDRDLELDFPSPCRRT